MKVLFTISGRDYSADLSRPLDISIAYRDHGKLRAWYLGPMVIEPVRDGDWTGEVRAGAPVNFRNIYFNPHAHGTHTECVGHISHEFISVNNFKSFHFPALLITVEPMQQGGTGIITREQLREALEGQTHSGIEALVVRTFPNSEAKKSTDYCHSDPCYFEPEALTFISEKGIDHLLTDLPSVDPEKDEGKLAAHRAFWQNDRVSLKMRTITEFIFAGDDIPDGFYLLELQCAPFENDATPSRPVLYPATPIKEIRT